MSYPTISIIIDGNTIINLEFVPWKRSNKFLIVSSSFLYLILCYLKFQSHQRDLERSCVVFNIQTCSHVFQIKYKFKTCTTKSKKKIIELCVPPNPYAITNASFDDSSWNADKEKKIITVADTFWSNTITFVTNASYWVSE